MITMLNYYFFKRCLESLPNHIKNNLEYDNDLLFNLSTFLDLGYYYKLFNPIKKDKYKLNIILKSDDRIFDFVLECLYICKKKNDYQGLLLIYAILSNKILSDYITPYINLYVDKKNSYQKLSNMIDYYYTKAIDKIDLTKISIASIFKCDFIYHDFIEQTIHNPLIKVYKFFCSKPYFTRALKRKEFYFTYCTLSTTKIKKLGFLLFDLIINHFKKPKFNQFIYSNKVNTTIFNLGKKPYLIGEETYNYNFDELLDQALKKTNTYIDAINQYIQYDNDKQLKKLWNIDKNEKLN
ncbi:TPA: hypothetical protein IAA91_01290 [Candidatus Avacholeplasma faecigallinarum]|nr:hypothetical protein [Candidatus Avacholeplasma faecigallinarum]